MPRFLGDDKGGRVRVLGHAYGRAVAGAQLLGDGVLLRKGQEAARGDDARAADDRRAVVQGGIGFKDVLQQRGRDDGIDGVAVSMMSPQGRLVLDDDQHADLALGEVLHAADDLLDHAVDLVRIPSGGASCPQDRCGGQSSPARAELWLEEHNQHHRARVHDVAQEPVNAAGGTRPRGSRRQ